MTFEEAVITYARHSSRDTVRDRAIISAIWNDLGPYLAGYLVAGNKDGSPDGLPDERAMDDLRDWFTRTVEGATRPVEHPRGVMVTQTPNGPVTHMDLDHRLHAEVRDDGHTYVDGERID